MPKNYKGFIAPNQFKAICDAATKNAALPLLCLGQLRAVDCIEWVQTTNINAGDLCGRAVVGGHENDCSPLWVIRARFDCDMVPGKLALNRQEAYVPWGHKEHRVENIEVCCAPSEEIEWIECRDGNVPPRAVKGGWTGSGETLYIGRKRYNGALTPGKIHPSTRMFYMSYGGQELGFSDYEVLCTV